MAHEVLTLFWINDIDRLKRETRNLAPDFAGDIWTKLAVAGGREVVSFTSSGFVAATSGIMVAYMRAGDLGFPCVINVREIGFGEDDGVLGLAAWRNSGWRVAGSGRERGRDLSGRDLIKEMGAEPSFTKIIVGKERRERQDETSRRHRQQRPSHDFAGTLGVGQIVRSGDQIERGTRNSDHHLLASVVKGDLDAFRSALAEGANPDITIADGTEPLVFALAADGRLAWVEALIASGRCDLTHLDASGLHASHAPGVTARFFAATGPDELVRKFARIAILLREEEARQLAATGPLPSFDP